MEHLNWEIYRTSFVKIPEDVLNEYRDDLHSMTVKDSLFKDTYLCPAYLRAMAEIGEFDNCNLDYFDYEKELNFGEGD